MCHVMQLFKGNGYFYCLVSLTPVVQFIWADLMDLRDCKCTQNSIQAHDMADVTKEAATLDMNGIILILVFAFKDILKSH